MAKPKQKVVIPERRFDRDEDDDTVSYPATTSTADRRTAYDKRDAAERAEDYYRQREECGADF